MRKNPIEGKPEKVHCFAVRRVNPFRGVMQIIESEEGRALSCNGVVWEILVRASHGNTSDSSACDLDKKYYRFGMWSMDAGLMKRSNSPVDDQDYFDLATKCDALIGYVQQYHDQLPFDIEDNLELWLFDKDDQRPLALLSSMTPDKRLPSAEPTGWMACIGADGTPGQRRFPQAYELESQVKQRAGPGVNKHWIRRLPDGDGVFYTTGVSIPAARFPVLLLDENWTNEEERRCVSEYFMWISPSLLTLQHLDKETRARIENNLTVQAISIEHHWHLYPEVIDQMLLNAARVQSEIEQSC